MSGLPRCGSCRALVRWVETTEGRRIPLDAEPDVAKASVWVNPRTGRARFLSAEEIARARSSGHRVDSIHHATCPSVERHRVPRAQTTMDLAGDAA